VRKECCDGCIGGGRDSFIEAPGSETAFLLL
jgi:hypothetical protein